MLKLKIIGVYITQLLRYDLSDNNLGSYIHTLYLVLPYYIMKQIFRYRNFERGLDVTVEGPLAWCMYGAL